MDNARPIEHRTTEADDSIWPPGLNTRQAAAHMDFVSHGDHIDRVTGIGVGRLGRVAKDAHLQSAT
jgi:hypothetical protein